jgi:pilus assembly protein CpaE
MNDAPGKMTAAPVLLVTFDDEFAVELAGSLEGKCPIVHVNPLMKTVHAAIESLCPHVVLFDLKTVKTEEQTIFDVLHSVHMREPDIRNIAIGYRSSTNQVIAAMKSGACDFLDRDAGPEEIEQTIANNLMSPGAHRRGQSGRIIAAVGAKPNEGENALATSLAAYIAASSVDLSVLLLDLDLELTELPIDFDVEITYSLRDALEEHTDLTREMLERVLTRHKSGLYLLPLALRRDSSDEISPQSLASMLGALRSMFDVIVVHASCLRDEVCRPYLIALCDHVLVLVSQRIGAIRAAQDLFGAHAAKESASSPLRLVIPDFESDLEPGASVIERHVGIPLLTTLPPARELLVASHNSGTPSTLYKPRSPYARSVARLAQTLVPECNGARRDLRLNLGSIRRVLGQVSGG